jgi:hypothetical protein
LTSQTGTIAGAIRTVHDVCSGVRRAAASPMVGFVHLACGDRKSVIDNAMSDLKAIRAQELSELKHMLSR